MTAQRNTMWQAHVRRLLSIGYGVEDIAIITKYKIEDVRAEVQILRDMGVLKGIFRRK